MPQTGNRQLCGAYCKRGHLLASFPHRLPTTDFGQSTLYCPSENLPAEGGGDNF